MTHTSSVCVAHLSRDALYVGDMRVHVRESARVHARTCAHAFGFVKTVLFFDCSTYFVALSLEEAECVRGFMHMTAGRDLIAGADTAVGLRINASINVITQIVL